MNPLIQISLFSKNFVALSEFYRDQFELTEIESLRSEIFRAYKSGDVILGFSSREAYELLNMKPRKSSDGDQIALTFQFADKESLDLRVIGAVEGGASLAKAQFVTYYGWYLAILRDPDGNAIRLACPSNC